MAGFNSDNFYSLPEVLSQKKVPVTASNMVQQEELKRWPYLPKVNIPCVIAEVDLLISTNAPKVLEPWEVVNSHADGPYAVRTVLGWVFNGPLHEEASSRLKTSFTVAVVNRISVCKLEKMLNNQYNYDFNERCSPSQEGHVACCV